MQRHEFPRWMEEILVAGVAWPYVATLYQTIQRVWVVRIYHDTPQGYYLVREYIAPSTWEGTPWRVTSRNPVPQDVYESI